MRPISYWWRAAARKSAGEPAFAIRHRVLPGGPGGMGDNALRNFLAP
jgi:hypothetical protein